MDGYLGDAHSGELTGLEYHPAAGSPLPTYPDQQVPGNKGATTTPTAAVVALFAQVALVQFWRGDQEAVQVYGLEPHHLLSCDALNLDHSWYKAPSAYNTKSASMIVLRSARELRGPRLLHRRGGRALPDRGQGAYRLHTLAQPAQCDHLRHHTSQG